jgi:hypothetical protein
VNVCVCVCARAGACACACVRACARVRVCDFLYRMLSVKNLYYVKNTLLCKEYFTM